MKSKLLASDFCTQRSNPKSRQPCPQGLSSNSNGSPGNASPPDTPPAPYGLPTPPCTPPPSYHSQVNSPCDKPETQNLKFGFSMSSAARRINHRNGFDPAAHRTSSRSRHSNANTSSGQGRYATNYDSHAGPMDDPMEDVVYDFEIEGDPMEDVLYNFEIDGDPMEGVVYDSELDGTTPIDLDEDETGIHPHTGSPYSTSNSSGSRQSVWDWAGFS